LLVAGTLFGSAVSLVNTGPFHKRYHNDAQCLVTSYAFLLVRSFIGAVGSMPTRLVASRVISDSKPDVLYLRSFATDPSFRRRLGASFPVG